VQVRFEVLDHLFLGFGDETEAGAVAGEARQRANRKRPGVPDGGQQAGAAAELANALLAPARWSVSSRAASSSAVRTLGLRAVRAWPW